MGQQKSGLCIGDVSLLDRAVTTMSTFAPGKVTAIVERGHELEGSQSETVRFVNDLPVPDQTTPIRAPLAGLFTALTLSESDWVAVLAVDLPFVTADLLTYLVDKIGDEIDTVVALQPDGRPQVLCGIFRRVAVLPIVERSLDGSDLSMRTLLSKLRTRSIDFAEIAHLAGSEHFFVNVNTPDDFDRAVTIVKSN